MKVTSNSLFHFTNSIENLESILSERFYLTYCKEEYTMAGYGFHGYYPMISFCDLPLSLAKDQFSKYGSYAIGLSKEWGVANKLNPVIYLEQNSGIAQDIKNTRTELFNSNSIIVEAVKEKKLFFNASVVKKLVESIGNNVNNFINTLRYTKNYSGTLKRDGQTIPNYRFYDEREWRYIPEMTDTRLRSHLTKEQYEAYRGDGKKPLVKEINIPFNSKDIKYMILKTDEEIPRLVSYLKTNSNLAANENELNILTTKIITCEQLESDF